MNQADVDRIMEEQMAAARACAEVWNELAAEREAKRARDEGEAVQQVLFG